MVEAMPVLGAGKADDDELDAEVGLCDLLDCAH